MSKFKTLPIKTQLVGLGIAGLVMLLNGCSSTQQKAENTCIKIYPDMTNHFDKYASCVVSEGGYEPVQAVTVTEDASLIEKAAANHVNDYRAREQDSLIKEIAATKAEIADIKKAKAAEEKAKALAKATEEQAIYDGESGAIHAHAQAYNAEVLSEGFASFSCETSVNNVGWGFVTRLEYREDVGADFCVVEPIGHTPMISYKMSVGEL